MEFRLFTFGLLRLEADGETVSGAAGQRRRLALLALLAATSPRGLTREKLLGLLWPEQPESRGRHLLSESMYVIRRALADDVIAASGEEIRVSPDLLWSDVAEFRQAITQGRFEDAADLYHGPFLDGFYLKDTQPFDEWVERERQDLSREYARALEALAIQSASAGDTRAAADWWHRLADHEPYSGRIALRYIEALAAAGDRTHAIQHAQAHAARLRQDLGVEPDAEVMRAAHRLAGDTGARPASRDGAPGFSSEFEIVRPIGAGSVAQVYLARESALKRLVAVKVLQPEHAAVETVRLRFEREAQAAARIQHPNVVTAFRFGRLDDGAPYIVSPYIDGGSLEDRLAAAGSSGFSNAQALKHIAGLAGGLAAAHKLGIVHRDVRPANILIDRATDRMMLTDFGLAAVLDASANSLRLTRPGEALGNVRYASPEQLRAEPVTERADVYSLGIVAFEMLTGRLPFDAASPIDLMVAHDSAEPRKLGEFVSGIDRKVEALLQRCLAKRPEQRPFAEELAGLG